MALNGLLIEYKNHNCKTSKQVVEDKSASHEAQIGGSGSIYAKPLYNIAFEWVSLPFFTSPTSQSTYTTYTSTW
jgi:hypothetical protein